jgi:hypothetical protein
MSAGLTNNEQDKPTNQGAHINLKVQFMTAIHSSTIHRRAALSPNFSNPN